jgi:hypothetical protein
MSLPAPLHRPPASCASNNCSAIRHCPGDAPRRSAGLSLRGAVGPAAGRRRAMAERSARRCPRPAAKTCAAKPPTCCALSPPNWKPNWRVANRRCCCSTPSTATRSGAGDYVPWCQAYLHGVDAASEDWFDALGADDDKEDSDEICYLDEQLFPLFMLTGDAEAAALALARTGCRARNSNACGRNAKRSCRRR